MKIRTSRRGLLAFGLCAVSLLCAPSLLADPLVVSGCGDIASRIAEFRSLVEYPGVVNWDAGPASIKAGTFSTFGVEFSTEGTGFRVSNNNFADLVPSYSSQFAAFSSPNSIAPIGSNRIYINLESDLYVKAFGIVFSDVDRLGSTSIRMVEGWDNFYSYVVPPRCDAAGHSFVGMILPHDSVANGVWIVSGDGPPAAGVADVSAGGVSDLVAIDDILFTQCCSSSQATKVTFPVVARTAGAAGTIYKTDLKVFNPSNTAVDVLVRLHQRGPWDYKTAPIGPANSEATVRVAPGEEKVLDDILMSGFGIHDGIGSLQLFSPRSIIAVARIYNDRRGENGGTAGQFVAGVSEDTETTKPAAPMLGVLPALSDSPISSGGPYRTNIGLFNDGPLAANLVLRAYDVNGKLFSTWTNTLPSRENVQQGASDFFAALGARENFYVTYTTDMENVHVYASVVDNVNGDAIYIPAHRRGGSSAVQLVFPAVARAPGANGTSYKTDMRIVNTHDGPASVRLEFYPGGGSGNAAPSATSVLPMAAGEELVLDDLLQSEFQIEKGSGAVHLFATVEVVAVARIYNDQRAAGKGTFGQFVDGANDTVATRASRAGLLPALSDSAGPYRTNIGWFNGSSDELATADANLTLRAFDVSGALLATRTIAVPAYSQFQQSAATIFPSLGARENFYVTYSSDVATPIYVYASVIDNVTGDAIYIPAQ